MTDNNKPYIPEYERSGSMSSGLDRFNLGSSNHDNLIDLGGFPSSGGTEPNVELDTLLSLKKSNKPADYVVVMTDGEAPIQSIIDPLTLTQSLAALHRSIIKDDSPFNTAKTYSLSEIKESLQHFVDITSSQYKEDLDNIMVVSSSLHETLSVLKPLDSNTIELVHLTLKPLVRTLDMMQPPTDDKEQTIIDNKRFQMVKDSIQHLVFEINTPLNLKNRQHLSDWSDKSIELIAPRTNQPNVLEKEPKVNFFQNMRDRFLKGDQSPNNTPEM